MGDVALILAAGTSSRMRGRDKLLEPVSGAPLITVQAKRAAAVCDTVLVALPPKPHPRYAALDGLSVTTVAVPESAEGMGGTLRGAVARLPEETTGLLLLLGDLPDITERDLRTVLDARSQAPEAAIWRGATEDGQPGHPILFSAETFPDFATLEGDDGGRGLVQRYKGRVHLVPLPGQRARRDLDTPEEWADWRATRES